MKAKRLLLALGIGLTLAAPAAVIAAGDHAGHGKAETKAPSTAAGDMVEGEVRKVDKAAGKVTLKHGEIKNLDMPGMTMVFQVKDPAILDAVKAGDKVRFRAEKSGASIVVTEMTTTAN